MMSDSLTTKSILNDSTFHSKMSISTLSPTIALELTLSTLARLLKHQLTSADYYSLMKLTVKGQQEVYSKKPLDIDAPYFGELAHSSHL